MGGNPEEDELLAELMQNACECFVTNKTCTAIMSINFVLSDII